jgi:hypothetical protein
MHHYLMKKTRNGVDYTVLPKGTRRMDAHHTFHNKSYKDVYAHSDVHALNKFTGRLHKFKK